ncbi:hypothetical protein EBR96_07855 [bacterium]|nr:hypothetical protein [bacterium]
MNNHTFTGLAREWPPGQLAAARAGYLEAAAGAPPSAGWLLHPSAAEAIAYERARLWVANMRAASLLPPPWPNRGRQLPRAVATAIAQADAKAGRATPPVRLAF